MNTALYSSRCMRHSTIRSTRYHSSLAKESLEAIGSRINATTSLPPPLLLPPTRKENESRVKYVYQVGKSYLAFYKAGFKQILANRNLVKEIRIRHDGDKLLNRIAGDAIDHRTGKLISVNTSDTTSQTLSRADYQLLRRHARDIKKVPVFALLLAIFGEWLPLFVVFLDPLIPGTVLLPVQVRKRRLKAAKAAVAVSTDRGLVDAVRDGLEGAGIHDRQQLVTTAKSFALLGPLSQFGPSNRILRRIRRHEEYLRTDDQLLRRDLAEQRQANIQALHEVEAELAIEERGLWRADQDHEARLKLMTEWLDSTEKQKG